MNITRIDGKLVQIDTDLREIRVETEAGGSSSTRVKYLNNVKPDEVERYMGENVALILYDGQVARVK